MEDMDPQRRGRVRELGELIASVTPDDLLLADDETFSAFYQALERSSITETAEFVVFDCLPVNPNHDESDLDRLEQEGHIGPEG